MTMQRAWSLPASSPCESSQTISNCISAVSRKSPGAGAAPHWTGTRTAAGICIPCITTRRSSGEPSGPSAATKSRAASRAPSNPVRPNLNWRPGFRWELFAAEGDDEDVAVAGLRRIERLDRRDAVKDAVVVGQGGVERLGQGEAAERLFRQIMDARLAALHIDPADQQHQHPIDAVAVHALRSRASLLTGARLDTELVDLDVPGIGTHRC